MTYLLDTNVVSELHPRRDNLRVKRWVHLRPVDELHISAVTVFELEGGVQQAERRDPAQGALLREWLEERVISVFGRRTLPLDLHVARLAAGLHIPDPKPERDAYIAATALVNDLTVVTRNVRDFERTGVRVVNPWED